ncbi:hypothetical protein [Candidatus Methanoperedens nitratireducens]|nr:hypothetical protein [Candidatus Methanoperedens nitroreducens]
MYTVGQKLEHLKDQINSGLREHIEGSSTLLKVRDAKDRFADKIIAVGMQGQLACMGCVSLDKLVSGMQASGKRIKLFLDDKEVSDVPGFLKNEAAEVNAKSLMVLIVGGIIVMKLASTMLPQANADWTAATAAGGAMANASASDKSTWNTGGSLIPVFGIAIVAGITIRAFGH